MKFIHQVNENDAKSMQWYSVEHVYRILRHYELSALLRSKGYKIINIGPWWSPVLRGNNPDIDVPSYPILGFFVELYQTTMLYHLDVYFGLFENVFSDRIWQAILSEFYRVAEIADGKSPHLSSRIFSCRIHPMYLIETVHL